MYKSLIIQKLNTVNTFLYKKLTLKGVGYKMSLIKKNVFNIIEFRLGFSHPIYIKVPFSIKLLSPNNTTLYILGNSIEQVNNLVFKIRSLRIPDSYKGKGILYEYEKLELKEGKKS